MSAVRWTPEVYEAHQRKRALETRKPIASTQIPPKPVAAPKAPGKYRNVKTNGYASKKEADRAEQLRLMEKAGLIRELREQVKFVLIPKQEGERECSYVADFVYQQGEKVADDLGLANIAWHDVVEDTKSPPTRANRAYVIKRKLMLHVHGIRIREL